METTKQTVDILVMWEALDEGGGRLIAKCAEDTTLSSNTVLWPEPITAQTDSWAVAEAVTEINFAEIVAVDHDNEYIHVTVDAAKTQ